jgi:hypothetical protein
MESEIERRRRALFVFDVSSLSRLLKLLSA